MNTFTVITTIIALTIAFMVLRYNKKGYFLQEKESIKKKTIPKGKKPTPKKKKTQKKVIKPPEPSLEPFIPHPYPLQQNFTGREREREMLTQWYESDEKAMLAVIAIGGMGKSSLAWYWLQEDFLKQGTQPEGVVWWSFYEKEAGFESFVNRTLKYASNGEINPQNIGGLWERVEALCQILREKRFLLVLDGVERLLRHYARLDAAYQKDKIKEKEEDQGFRACADPLAGNFLEWMAVQNVKSKILITSRLFPLELEELAGCQKEKLVDFSPDDAHRFFERQGLDWTSAEVNQVCQPFGFLPLSLRLLTGIILHDPIEPGDAHPNPKKIISQLTHELKPGKHHILEKAYDSLEKDQKKLLSRIAAFRSPIDYQAVSTISPDEDKEAIKEILSALIGRGLLLVDPEKTTTYDLHPIVRSYCYDRLQDKSGTHTKLRDYFSALPQPKEIKSVEDLSPVIELYHHTLRAGEYDKAMVLFYERLARPLYFTFGAYQLRIELLRGLFPDGENKPPRLENKAAQGWTLNALATSYSSSGQPRQSVPLKENAIKLSKDSGNEKNEAIGLGNLALNQMALGDLTEAEANLRRSIEIGQKIKDKFNEAIGHQELGRCLAYRGNWSLAEEELKTALNIQREIKHEQTQGLTWAYRSLAALLREDFPKSREAAREAYNIATGRQNERDRIQAEWLLGAAQRGMFETDPKNQTYLQKAETHIREALTRCRRINLVESEADILLELARVRRLESLGKYRSQIPSPLRGEGQGAPSPGSSPPWGEEAGNLWNEAGKLTRKALKIAGRCGYILIQADIHLFLAQLALDAEDKETARREGKTAIELASCGYKPTLEQARKLLNQLS